MKPDDYMLLSSEEDRDSAYRWNVASEIRKRKGLSSRNKILEYLKKNLGKEITGEELRYVTNNASEWARRTRELRTQEGWQIVTKSTGRPDLPISVYVLESAVQAEKHDREISDADRRAVLMRDKYSCLDCGWNKAIWNKADPRHLELHHVEHHAKGGANTPDNLITLCNICHDNQHKK